MSTYKFYIYIIILLIRHYIYDIIALISTYKVENMAHKRLKIVNPNVREALKNALAMGVMSISDACKSIRAIFGYSQEDFANSVGLSVKVIKEIESGKGNPRLSSLERLADVADLRVVFAAPKGSVKLEDFNERSIEKQQSREQDFDIVSSGAKSYDELVSANSIHFGKYKYKLPESI